jgi:hypothetical protein
MATEFNIKDLFRKVFGHEPPPNFRIDHAVDPDRVSSLGQPYYNDDVFGREIFMPVKLNDYWLHLPVIGISSKKVVVSTAMPERKGTVKELISSEDYIITIKGIIIRPDNNFPEAEIRELEEIKQKDESITMRSALTDIFLKGDFEHRVVIKALSFPEVAGVQHARPYQMELESDQIFDLEIE